MSSDETIHDVQHHTEDSQMHEPAPPADSPPVVSKKRPRLDLNVSPRERKRGKSMFGLVLGTLKKATIEEKERNASEAAKKRQLIEQRLQTKLRKETDSVRRAEEAKKAKTLANRKEEDLQLKDSIQKLRRTRLPLLANFLLTSDEIPPTPGDDDVPASPHSPATAVLKPVLTNPPRTHPPPLYYLPAILTPAQEALLAKRKIEVAEAAEAEWFAFREERAAGIEAIHMLRQRVVEEEARRRSERESEKVEGVPGVADGDTMATDDVPLAASPPKEALVVEGVKSVEDDKDAKVAEVEMDVDDGPAPLSAPYEQKEERKDEPVADDDDAVEY